LDGNGSWNVVDIVQLVDLIHAAEYTPHHACRLSASSTIAPLAGSPGTTLTNRIPSSVRLSRIYEALPTNTATTFTSDKAKRILMRCTCA
jgi:hypothetical protein